MSEIINNEEMDEFVVFTTTTKDGKEIELAVVDEFEFEKKNYVAASLVEGDTIVGDDIYIYQLKLKAGDEFEIEKITAPGEYEKVAEAYLALESE